MRKIIQTVGKVLVPSAAATSTMTLFSYAVARLTKQQFREPVLLDHFVGSSPPRSPVRGWVLHYLIGVGFTGVYQLLWRQFFRLTPTPDGLGYGALGGLLGMLGWRITFATHPNPPRINLRAYLAQLFVAHLIFGLTLSYTSNLYEDD